MSNASFNKTQHSIIKTTQTLPAVNLHKLTSWEWEGLQGGYNIADGHAHQEQSPEYIDIIKNLPHLYLRAEKNNQKDIQDEFEKVFFKKAGQKSYKKLAPPLYQAACSLSIEVVANYLRLTKKSVALFHPTFDNLADILKRHNIPLFALEENILLDPENRLKNTPADALFLVCPNNPTGTDITKKQYISVVEYCKKNNKLLIVDCSFRFYSSLTTWDQYDLLKKSGIDFIVLEDTGKTWPTLELKIGTTVASDRIYSQLADITNDFLLNVSPFVFTLLTEYINVELKNKSYHGAQSIVSTNRSELKIILKDLPFTLQNPSSKLSVAWIKLPKKWRATEFCKWAAVNQVHVLPGSPFFWNNPERGESYFRIALLRPTDKFIAAAQRLHEAALTFKA